MSGSPLLVDARGMRCPWPVLRVARAARQAGVGALIHVVADDPAAAGELARLVEANGWSIAPAVTAIGPGSAITVT
ncbi:tRNA 2-thiouridine synthesizing protein A [Sphingomonas zeicaulis]|uniref:sulfurtransferase TusA family protein n=1 Tax=Sphingomonas zeicaulis TaxID=1632740 RepID=UPI003D1DB783